ncbi:SusC/RagA family TonB-linked outer membrane protein [Puteibacter caeruleilacunae]|nr:SusC/RagA family TonB-linked outer membrane protein [Puteibacter caeruleilacunae]
MKKRREPKAFCLSPLWDDGAFKKLIRMLRISVFCFFLSMLQTFAVDSYSQDAKLSIDIKNQSLEVVLDRIEDNTDYFFVYNADLIDVEQTVSVHAKNQSVKSILLGLLKEKDIKFSLHDNLIVLSKGNISEVAAENVKISGRVVDDAGESLPGVSVIVKGTTIGTVTDGDGNYTLANVPEGATLVFSFIGMATQEIPVGSATVINIKMMVDAVGLDEVVAIGYGVVKKSDLTGSVGTVKAEEISKQSVTRIDQALQGRISGVQISTTSGAPGSGASIRIRGGNSINAGNEPLYVIDGFIGGGDLNSINPNDIESVEVLKDASATAIYGSRGSNGVILITTKRGSGSKGFGVSFDCYWGMQSPIKKLDLLNGPEFAEYRNEFAEVIGTTQPFPNLDEVSNTDWQDILFRDVPMTSNTLNFYNNTEKSNYYVSLNYLDQDGIQLGSSYTRYQIRFNFDQKLGEFAKVGASLNASKSDRENPRASALGNYILPTAPVYLEDGSFHRVDAINGSTYNNPVAQNELRINNTVKDRALGNVYVQLMPLKGMIFKSTFGFDNNTSKQNTYNSVNLPTNFEAARGGQASISTNFGRTIQNENTLNYSYDIEDHSFNVLGGWTYQSYKGESLSMSAKGFTNDVTTFNAVETGDPELLTANSGESSWTLLSGLYRLNYSYKDRYLLTVSGRHDGSSRLAEGNQWHFFPSAAIAWRLVEEDFIKDLDVFSNLKLRVSYGKTGSQSIAPYATLARLSAGKNYLGDQQLVTFLPAGSADPSLKWEVTDQYDIGFEAGLFKNRLSIEVDYYSKKTTDLLLSRELPYQTGFSSRLENVGSLQNKGIDVTLRGVILKKNDFTWSSDLTVSSNKNEILELSKGKEFIENGVGSRLIVGESVSTFFGAKFIGLWQEGDEGLGGAYVPGAMKFEDVDKDGVINVNDGQIIGKGTPDFYGGFNNVFTYKRFTLSAFFDFSYGNDIYDLDGRIFNTGFASNVYGKFRNRWTPENTNTNVPKAGTQQRTYYNNYTGRGGSSYDIYDGSYFRMKNLNLNYELPIKSNIIESLAIYGTATNVFTITNYKGFSPDVNATGTHSTRRGFDSNGYPPAKMFLIGVKADF